MITPFDLRDVPLVRELSGLGLSLDTETALTQGVHLLRNALAAYFARGERGMPTYVLRKGQNGCGVCGLAQMRHRPGRERARIAYIAPHSSSPSSPVAEPSGEASGKGDVAGVWVELLEHLTRQAGARGAQSVVAEVSVDDAAFAILRGAGFAVYTRQDVLRLGPAGAPEAGAPSEDNSAPALIELSTTRLRPRRPEDMWSVAQLYTNTAPRLLQLAEPPPAGQNEGGRHGYVLEDRRRGDVVAYLDLRQGPAGTWIKAWLHPDAEERAGELIAGALQLIRPGRPRPVYWCVRRYQDWLRGPLADSGFAEWISEAVMVRHTVARVDTQTAQATALALEHQPKVVAPMSHRRLS